MSEKDIYGEIEKHRLLLQKYFDGVLDPEERGQLASWLWSDRRNRDLLGRLHGGRSLRERFEIYRDFDTNREFEMLTRRYKGIRRRRWVIRWSGVAAVLVVTICAALFLNRGSGVDEGKLVVREGKLQAVLTTADGDVIPIKERMIKPGVLAFQIKDSLKELICEQADANEDSVRYHRLDVPRGGEYTLVLADGSSVRLNSESSIRFPESFSGSMREVEVHGEVYFEVVKDRVRPFIVHANELKIEVLGTRFGVRVYRDETMTSTTLAEGRVRVVAGKSDMVLVPGEQAYLEAGQLRKRTVDVDKTLAWVNGLFVFEHDKLSYVANQLTRWYDVQVRFANEKLKDYQFTGTVGRDEGIEGILNLMEKMNVVSFEKKDGYFLIKENDKVRMYN